MEASRKEQHWNGLSVLLIYIIRKEWGGNRTQCQQLFPSMKIMVDCYFLLFLEKSSGIERKKKVQYFKRKHLKTDETFIQHAQVVKLRREDTDFTRQMA
jgi:hypothetical protein